MRTVNRIDIEDALDEARIYDENAIRDGYSGRGMGDQECFGLVLEYPSEIAMFYQALNDIGEETDDVDLIELSELLRKTERSDSMGRRVIFYWPSFKLGA